MKPNRSLKNVGRAVHGSPNCRIVKLGGSLLGSRNLVDDFRRWLDGNGQFVNLVLCGGGPAVDALRKESRSQSLEPADSHWAAIRQMNENTRSLASRLPELPLNDLSAAQFADRNCFVDCYRMLRQCSGLPCDWTVSSDSLAAELAWLLQLEEVCLLKSALPSNSCIHDWSATGFVDEHFPVIASRLRRVTVVNLNEGNSLSIRPK